jgi:type VI protein secretion system component VasF
MQYLYGTIVWGLIVNTCGKTKDDDKVDVFEWINVPTWVLFALKVVLFLIAYYFLLVFVVKKGVI